MFDEIAPRAHAKMPTCFCGSIKVSNTGDPMNYCCRALGVLAVLAIVCAFCFTATVSAQEPVYDPTAKPMFVVRTPGPAIERNAPVTPLTQWTYKWTYQGQNLTATIVGTDPSKTNTTTTIK